MAEAMTEVMKHLRTQLKTAMEELDQVPDDACPEYEVHINKAHTIIEELFYSIHILPEDKE